MKYFLIGDVHGELDMLEALLDNTLKANLPPRFQSVQSDDHVIFLGDLIDRGSKSAQVVEYIRAMSAKMTVTVLKGNHEQMMIDGSYNATMSDARLWGSNGGVSTLDSYGINPFDNPQFKNDIDWMKNLSDGYIDFVDRFIAVHAGFDPEDKFMSSSPEERIWSRRASFFDSGSKDWSPANANMIVFHGHTPYIFGSEYRSKGRRINLDGGACYREPSSRLCCAEFNPHTLNIMIHRVDCKLNYETEEYTDHL